LNKLIKKIDYNENARIFKALAHPTRLHIIAMIREKESSVKMMEKILGLAQPNISQHLSLLRNMGIVEAERTGNHVSYHIKNQTIIKLLDVLFN
jgi:ArsR family transcriptional regulator